MISQRLILPDYLRGIASIGVLAFHFSEHTDFFLNFKFILLNLIIVLLTFFLLLFFYNYGIEDFISSNIYFNLEYSKDYFKFKNITIRRN